MINVLFIMIKKIMIVFLIGMIVFCAILAFSNGFIIFSVAKNIISIDDAKEKNADCILVLGAAVIGTKKPSPILADRIEKGVEVYQAGASKRMVMSGEHLDRFYNEVLVMKNYAIDKGVPSQTIFLDPAGYSTYDSLYRMKSIFKGKKVIIVTQRYHLYRALYIAKQLGIEVWGVAADHKDYPGNFRREIREIFARSKDYFACIIQMEPKSLGSSISLDGNGDDTH